jgi:multicomponent Na+:H+ antiporter subunit E
MEEKGSSLHLILLCILLGIVWMAWSGHTEPLLVGFGVGSLLITVWVSKRLSVIDEEGQPTNPKLLGYIPWLLKEIVVANIDVIGRILSRDPKAVDPTWIRVPAKQTTRLGRVIFANSITLTPGTVSVTLDDGIILVNAISTDGAESLINGGVMGERVCELEKK